MGRKPLLRVALAGKWSSGGSALSVTIFALALTGIGDALSPSIGRSLFVDA